MVVQDIEVGLDETTQTCAEILRPGCRCTAQWCSQRSANLAAAAWIDGCIRDISMRLTCDKKRHTFSLCWHENSLLSISVASVGSEKGRLKSAPCVACQKTHHPSHTWLGETRSTTSLHKEEIKNPQKQDM
jgi:hypothetical protein